MGRYKDYSYEQTVFLPANFKKQVLPGTFEYTLNNLIKLFALYLNITYFRI